MNHKRGRPKSSRNGCLLCKPHKHQGRKKADRRARNEPHDGEWPGYSKWEECPDCDGTGRCSCKQCVEEKIGCLYCLGSGIVVA